MSKIRIKTIIKNSHQKETNTVNAILIDDILKYKEKDNTVVIYDYKANTLLRENNKLRMNYNFNNHHKTTGSLTIKELNSTTSINIKTNHIKRKDNDIVIKYQIDDEEFLYQIEEIK